jgi:GDP-L-fucose synthase
MESQTLDGKILITGSGGILGSYLKLLLPPSDSYTVLAPTREELDLSSFSSVKNYFSFHVPDIVIHLAATVFGLGGNLANPIQALVSNTTINNNLFAVLALHPPQHIFFAGTVASYPYPYPAEGLKEEFLFTGLPHGGEYGYAMAKRHAYAYLELLRRQYATSFNYGIFTNLYGRYDKFDITNGHVIPSLIAKAYAANVSDSPLEVWGNPLTTRDFLHAADAAGAILHLLKNSRNLKVVNISSGCETSILSVAEIIKDEAKLSDINFDSSAPVGISRRLVNNEVLLGTGFAPSVPIDFGLRSLYQWYSQNFGKVRA